MGKLRASIDKNNYFKRQFDTKEDMTNHPQSPTKALTGGCSGKIAITDDEKEEIDRDKKLQSLPIVLEFLLGKPKSAKLEDKSKVQFINSFEEIPAEEGKHRNLKMDPNTAIYEVKCEAKVKLTGK